MGGGGECSAGTKWSEKATVGCETRGGRGKRRRDQQSVGPTNGHLRQHIIIYIYTRLEAFFSVTMYIGRLVESWM